MFIAMVVTLSVAGFLGLVYAGASHAVDDTIRRWNAALQYVATTFALEHTPSDALSTSTVHGNTRFGELRVQVLAEHGGYFTHITLEAGLPLDLTIVAHDKSHSGDGFDSWEESRPQLDGERWYSFHLDVLHSPPPPPLAHG